MQCDDLERYLEGFLDGRLGRTRTSVLKRHLSSCVGCRVRLERLRHFERDFNKRLRVGERADSVWSPLEIDLVRSAQIVTPALPAPLRLIAPPPEPAPVATLPEPVQPAPPVDTPRRRRRLAPTIVGAILVVVAAGAVTPAARLLLAPNGAEDGHLQLLLRSAASEASLPLRTSDPVQLRNWLAVQTGVAFPVLPTPAGFTLAGARVAREGGGPMAQVLYKGSTAAAVLELRPDAGLAGAAPAPCTASEDGLASVSWQSDGFGFKVLAYLPGRQLAGFAPAAPIGACAG